MVGSRRLELPTSSVSRKRSNQLSYEPTNGGKTQYSNHSVIATIVPGEFPSSRLFTKMNAGVPSTIAISTSSRSASPHWLVHFLHAVVGREFPHRLLVRPPPPQQRARHDHIRRARIAASQSDPRISGIAAPRVINMRHVVRAQAIEIARRQQFRIRTSTAYRQPAGSRRKKRIQPLTNSGDPLLRARSR